MVGGAAGVVASENVYIVRQRGVPVKQPFQDFIRRLPRADLIAGDDLYL